VSREPWGVINGDVSEILPEIEPASFDGVLCDPPYGLRFMGKAWDHGVPGEPVWRMVLDALKPGAHLLAFGGTRTEHRLVCAIEDAGFAIRDKVMWLYGQGFPKSMDISKAIDKAAGATREVAGRYQSPENTSGPNGSQHFGNGDRESGLSAITTPSTDLARRFDGYGTTLKPAWEPCVVAMKPLEGTFKANAAAHGVAGLNIDGSRIGVSKRVPTGDAIKNGQARANSPFCYSGGWGPRGVHHTGCNPNVGRWPSNLILDDESAVMLDAQSGYTEGRGASAIRRGKRKSRIYGGQPNAEVTIGRAPGDSGGASRFFYCAKAGRRERNAGLEGFEHRPSWMREAGFKTTGTMGRVNETECRTVSRNHHPTLKPIDLCRYLATLILPPKRDTPRRLLVPFSGSGSEMIGAMLAGWDEVVGIEAEKEYIEIARARLSHWRRSEPDGLFEAAP